ncbi:MAG: esterase/lipase family protein [Marinobacter sp.]
MSLYHPIIYVRGYAMTANEIADTVSMPYMGFNLGATKIRQSWDGAIYKQVFESPMVRLMKDYGYTDAFSDGAEVDRDITHKTLVIYRYYDQADQDFGEGKPLSIPAAALQLRDLILNIRQRLCGDNPERLAEFRVHLVAHSMGGLVCRCLLQNGGVSIPSMRKMVDKVFTYATPHNGIEIAGINVPAFLGLWDINNFNRETMADYLGLDGRPERVDTLDGKFDPDRFFSLVGTNQQDYSAAKGVSKWLAGKMSDGLVAIENASVQGAPRAFVYRSHSGPYGIVNSEDGYQNMVRFLFGDVRVDGVMDVESLPLPPSVQKARQEGRRVRASYYFEATVSPRGVRSFRLTERRRETFSAVLRKFDELMKPKQAGLDSARSPVLFSTFLDSSKITVKRGRTLVMTVELAVSATDYFVDGALWAEQRVEGEYLYRDTLTLRMTPSADDWNLRYVTTDEQWSERDGSKARREGENYLIPLSSKKGFQGNLRITLQHRT